MASKNSTKALIERALRDSKKGKKKSGKRGKKSVTLSKGEVFKALQLVDEVKHAVAKVVSPVKKGGGKLKKAGKKRSKKASPFIGGSPFGAAPSKRGKKRSKKAGKKRSKKGTIANLFGGKKASKKRGSKKSKVTFA